MTIPCHGCILALLLVTIAGRLHCGIPNEACNSTKTFDVEAGQWDQFVLSLQWPYTACRKMGCSTSKEYWTIHGLWPGFSSKKDCPTGCANVPFDNRVKSERGVNDYWPDLRRDPSKFWKYEWEKHGQCALQSSRVKDCLDYFRRAVRLRTKNSPNEVLNNNGIVPRKSKTYKTKDIKRALDRGFGKSVRLRCLLKGGNYYLGEVHLCYTRSLVLKSCNNVNPCGTDDDMSDVMELGIGVPYTDCPISGSVYYPRS